MLIIHILFQPAFACLWDHDTLQQERSQFPSAIELITGKFLRHSREFYEWRIKDRLQKLAADPKNLAYYDDLGVAYQKTGQHRKAVETMFAKEKLKPGLYETNSNLGTFYVLSGDLEDGLKYIDKALEINPHAHFDRERYQKWIVEYALSKKKDGQTHFPLHHPSDRSSSTFVDFLAKKLDPKKDGLNEDEAKKAVQAVLGMMRFADYDNPLLLEALGDLLWWNFGDSGAKQLSARAYLAALYKFRGKPEEQAYRQLAKGSLSMQVIAGSAETQLELSALESDFSEERQQAENWYLELRKQEDNWISKGMDADAEFDKLYKTEPQVFDKNAVPFGDQKLPFGVELIMSILTIVALISIPVLAVIFLFLMLVSRRKRRKAAEKKDLETG